MLNRFANFICPQSFKLLKFPIFCLLMNFGLLNLGYLDQTSNIASASVVASTVNSLAPIKTLPDSDGIYLYSQSSEPKQLGQGYVVFEKHNQRVIGALYMLQSEFSCFQGELSKSGNLSLTVTSLQE